MKYFHELGYTYIYGPMIAPDGEAPERGDYGQVVLVGRLWAALERLNPTIPSEALEEAFRKLTRLDSPALVANNHTFHHDCILF